MTDSMRDNSGMALIYVFFVIMVILGALGLVMTQMAMDDKGALHANTQVLLEEAAQAGIDFAVERLWNRYQQTLGNTTSNWASYRTFLDESLQLPINEDLNFNGQQDPDEVGNGRDGFETLPSGMDPRGMSLLEDPIELIDPESGFLMAAVDSVYVSRYDTASQARLTVRATATSQGRSLTATQVLLIGGAQTQHGQFAILANNISCILCHAQIRSLDLQRNSDPSLYGTFDRVKIAALESLLVRTGSEPDSNVAGTVYTRGEVYKPSGALYTAAELASNGFKSYEFSTENGKIVQAGNGSMIERSLSNSDVNADGEPSQFANLYLNYPNDPDLQTDGPLPTTFPAPFPDENENRYVDDDEFQIVMDTATGSISGGVVYGVSRGGLYEEDGLPSASNTAAQALAQSGSFDGNVVLVGTNDDPIRVTEKIAINGDLVIAGPVQGEGQLQVRGNTYIVGDVTYADAPGQFGVAPDGTDNALAIIGGGSIMMGDYLTIRGVNERSQDNEKFPAWNRYSIHMRDEHRSNTVNGQKLEWGYFDRWSSDPGQIVPGKPGQQFSFTQSELMLFNNLELEKALDDPEYIPRFYGLRASQPYNIYVYDAGDEHSVRYSESSVKLLSDYLIERDLPLEILDRAAIHYTSPDGNWISEDALREIWHDDEMTRPSTGRPFKFDGLLYSNNAIFTMVRSYTRHYSNTKGRMALRGGVIAADLGVFVPEGLTVDYDARVERFLEVHDTSIVEFQRAAFLYEREDNQGEGDES